jgi:nitroimidazol reductase NimA-like FMN-containing flavoprotein (pyridoxamine 5'-phosphate oxidase superfamily)
MTAQHGARTTESGRQIDLDRAECLRLLGKGIVGRVVFTDRALPAAHPVTYLLDGEEVVFRTAGGGKLSAARRHNALAFQIDEIDLGTSSGWRVLGIGECYEVVDQDRLADLALRLPPPWAATARDGHVIAIPMQSLTGRRVLAGA